MIAHHPYDVRRRLIALLSCLLAGSATGHDLASRLENLIDACHLDGARISAAVVDLNSGDVLYDHNADMAVPPASTMKMLTAALALSTFGPAHTFRTNLCADALPDDDGIIRGSLYLVGSGDPMLSLLHLRALATRLRAQGVRAVTGNVVGDGSLFPRADEYPPGWTSEDKVYYYGAPASGLSVEHNSILATVAPGPGAGTAADIRLTPLPDYLRIVNRVQTVQRGGRLKFWFRREPESNELVVQGSIPLGTAPIGQWCGVPDPPLYAACILAHCLREAGIATPQDARQGAPPLGAKVIAHIDSAPLADAVRVMMKRSNNHIAEQLLRLCGRAAGQRATRAEGLQCLQAYLQSLSIDTSAARFVDGCGLSRLDRVPARVMVGVLRAMHGAPSAAAFQAAFPIAGVDGTLRRRMQKGPAFRRIIAKTGYLSGTTTLTGYVLADGTPRLAFAFLATRVPSARVTRAAQDRFCAAVVTWLDARVQAVNPP